jgi:hypothetical protein
MPAKSDSDLSAARAVLISVGLSAPIYAVVGIVAWFFLR